MKKIIITGIVALAIGAFSFKLVTDKTSATVESIEGIGIYTFSKPVNKYDILGQVKVTGIVKSTRGPYMVKLLAEQAKKNHPSGEAIIVGSDYENAEVIRFKD